MESEYMAASRGLMRWVANAELTSARKRVVRNKSLEPTESPANKIGEQ
jgi:hypothetical protein